MKTLTDRLAQYAAYHRDRRNIATHIIGIPMIVAAVAILLYPLGSDVAGIRLTATHLAVLASGVYYLKLDARIGVLMCGLLGLALWLGAWAAAHSIAVWLALGLGGFVVGWIIQFIGHAWEGRKPAFVDDLVGLVIGPLFVVCELLFVLGLRLALRDAVEARVGPTRHQRTTTI